VVQQPGGLAKGVVLARSNVARFPRQGLCWKTLGALLWWQGDVDEAVAAMQTAARLLPGDAEANNNLGMVLVKLQRDAEAHPFLQKAADIDPKFAAAHYHLAKTHMNLGRFAEAEASLRTGLSLNPDYFPPPDLHVYSDLAFLASHNPAIGADELFAEHRRVAARFEAGVPAWPQHANDRDPERCLQVGFVSGDFRKHAVALFAGPVLERLHLCPGLELHAYYNNTLNESVTQRLRACFAHWHPVPGLPEAELARRIMEHGIDILIDLSGHTGLNRLIAFAHKPAPVQVSWLGYVGTTGLAAMDYYLTDRHFLPPDLFARQFTEKLVYLPAAAPFRPLDPESTPPVDVLPALATGSLCFGSFNRIGKINDPTLDAWSALLRALPTATMLVGNIVDPGQRNSLIGRFAARGIGGERLTFHDLCGVEAYLELHARVDLCLDTRPWTGGATTNHALWMGVPTLTLTGTTPASRLGVGLLAQVGLEDFAAASVVEFVAKGIHWAHHLGELAALRADLRRRCIESPHRQPEVIAAAMERALRHMWRRWCAGLPAESFAVT
jgi:predicted O-linked N-acetylglucosamine transferase (SPINDLY family)